MGILEYCQNVEKQLKFPNEFDEFYQRFDKEEAEDEAAAGGDKGKDAKGKDAKGKGGKKGKDVEEEAEAHEVGPSPVVRQFMEQINVYTEMWETRDESKNFDQRHDV